MLNIRVLRLSLLVIVRYVSFLFRNSLLINPKLVRFAGSHFKDSGTDI